MFYQFDYIENTEFSGDDKERYLDKITELKIGVKEINKNDM